MYEEIDEPIRVTAKFEGARLIPLSFTWKHDEHAIKQITFVWSESQGEAKLLLFSVTDGANTYELSYNTKTLEWLLAKVYVEGK